MKISTKGRYALRLMLDIAENQGAGFVTLKDISLRQEISKKYLEQIALQLSQAGLLRAARGHRGGYRLEKEPRAYTALEILSVTEGSLAPVACLDYAPNACPRCGECRTLPLWEALSRHIQAFLGGVTLQDLLDGSIAPLR